MIYPLITFEIVFCIIFCIFLYKTNKLNKKDNKKKTEKMLKCKKCNGTNIQKLAWVDANTNKYIEEGTDESYDRWCTDCQEHVKFINV